MDRAVEQALEKLARQLLTQSSEFESSAAAPDLVGGLSLLGSLGKVTQDSLQSVIKKPEPTLVTAPSAPAPMPVAPQYESARQEYRPALQDQSLVQALLALTQGRQQPTASQPEPVAVEAPAMPRFEFADVPEVTTAQPKERPFRRSPGEFQTILRSR